MIHNLCINAAVASESGAWIDIHVKDDRECYTYSVEVWFIINLNIRLKMLKQPRIPRRW